MTPAQLELERERIYDQARRLGLRFNRFRDRAPKGFNPYAEVGKGDVVSLQSAVLESDLLDLLEQLGDLFEGEE